MALVAQVIDMNFLMEYQQYSMWVGSAKLYRKISLKLNVNKTKELCCGGRGQAASAQPLFDPRRGEEKLIEQAGSLKQLELETDVSLSFLNILIQYIEENSTKIGPSEEAQEF